MREHNCKLKSNRQHPEDDLDRVLDVALAKYASVEPRAGLEKRIVANLRAADRRPGRRSWWIWGFAAVAAIVLVAATLTWRSWTAHPPIANHPPNPQQVPISPKFASREGSNVASRKPATRATVRRAYRHDVVATNPKLDVFPSPLPLSEQEKILAAYIENFPEHAALVAEARMDALRQQDEERRRISDEEQQ